MKTYIRVLLILLLVVLLTGCGLAAQSAGLNLPDDQQNPPQQDTSQPPDVLQTPDGQGTQTDVQNTPDDTAQQEEAVSQAQVLWEEVMEGCWTAGDEQFAYFTWKDGRAAFYGGTWEDEKVIDKGAGLVIDFNQASDTCHITALWQENGEVQEIILDIAGIDNDGKVNITFQGETRTYSLGGLTYDDAYDSVHQGQVEYAGFEEIRQAWDPLCGRWTAAGNRVVDFDYNENGEPTIAIGEVDNDGRKGTFQKAMSPLTYELGAWNKLIFTYEEPFEIQEIYLDLSGLDRDGGINLRVGKEGEVYQLGRSY